MAEVYAGFSEYTDAQVGRILDYLEASQQLDDTLIVYCAAQRRVGQGLAQSAPEPHRRRRDRASRNAAEAGWTQVLRRLSHRLVDCLLHAASEHAGERVSGSRVRPAGRAAWRLEASCATSITT
jgi:Sulfatase